jgi:hypothetical protein
MAILQTKYVDVGVYTIYGTTITGFISTGTVSNTQNGSSDVNLDSVFSGADITSFYHSSTSGQGLSLSLSGNRANGTFDTLKIGGVSFARTSATHSYNSSNNRTTWTWSSVSSSPFGTTVGADKQVTWENTSATVTAPVISGVSNNNAAAATVTATISLSSSGSGGTLQYAQTTSNSAPSSGWSAAPAFSHPRGATRYYWARRDTNTVTSSVSHSVGYLTGDTGFSKTSPTIAHNASSATTTIQYATAGETLAIRLNGQSTNLVTAAVASSSQSQNITFSSSLPSAGSSSTYRFFVRRPTNTGGDGSTFVDTNGTFTVTRTAAPPSYTLTAPTSINEGSSGTLNIATANVSTGTSLYWSVTSSGEFTGSTTGTVTTNSSGAASFSVTPTADSSTEGALTVTARIRTGSQAGTIVAFDTFVINDTSTTPGGGSTGGQTGGTGSNDYGIEIYGPDNSTVVFGTDLRCTNIYVYDVRNYAANSSHSFTGIANATDSSKIEVALSSGFGFSSASYSFARSSANGGTITVSNGTGQRAIETVVITIG